MSADVSDPRSTTADAERSAGRVVYALTSAGLDMHSATTRVSVASLRISNPRARAIIVCDPETNANIARTGDPLRSEVDEWVVRDTPEGPPVFRNRFLKTSLRRWLDGPFLYLDGDTVVRGDLADLFHGDTDVAAAPNHSQDEIADQIWSGDREFFARMGWSIGTRPFVNGGVIYLNDTSAARVFAEQWHDFWRASVAVGVTRDQPSLNAAIDATRPRVWLLPHRYNAQCRMNPSVSINAVIDHYYSARAGSPAAAQRLAEQLVHGAVLEADAVRALVRREHPWIRRSWLDDLVAARIKRRGVIEDADVFWLDGRWFDSVAIRVRDMLPFGRPIARFLRRITGRTVHPASGPEAG